VSDLLDVSASVGGSSLERAKEAARAVERAADAGESAEAAERFEALLATLLVKEMRRALPEGTLFPGAGSDVYDAWFDEHVGSALADGDALGLASQVRISLADAARAREQEEEGA
jgi:Rod binding domain-containing protein